MFMEENVVLQVILHGEEGLEIRVGNQEKINPLTLIGILEQVKMNILSGGSMETGEAEMPVQAAGKYDA
jgi:hypothetical protein